MHNWRRSLVACVITCGTAIGEGTAAAQTPPPAAAVGQTSATPAGHRLRVFLDCDCFSEFLRDEIEWVDYVRQAQDADVHLMSRSTETGGGGRELVLRFVGRGRFEGVDQELRVVTLAGDTEDTQRRAVLRTVTVGFLGYMARTGLPTGVDVSVEARDAKAAAPRRDRWNLWVFEIEASGGLEAQESSRNREGDVRVSADRVSEMWKISFGASAETQIERFTLEFDPDDPEESGTFESRRSESSIEGLVVRSLGPRWSFGAAAEMDSSTFGNTRRKTRVAPALEFSLFPYAEYATRQLVLQYQAGVEAANYYEITLYDKLSETLRFHEASIRLDQEQPWGSLQAQLQWQQYLHDFSKYRLEVSGEVDIRITRGLSLSFDGSASRIRDQLALPKRNADPSEVLLRLRELQSGYDLDFSFGITYSFGSLFNNVVNPRFGG